MKKKKEKEALKLPTERSKLVESLQDYSMLIYGEKKIGKTSLLAEIKRAVFFMFEPGGKSLEIYQVPIKSWGDFRKYITLLLKNEDFDTAIIDTSDRSYELCMDYVCDKLVIEHPSDEDYGKGWNAVKKEFTSQINRLLHSGKGVIFTSHTKNASFKSRKNDETNKITSSMSSQAKSVLEGVIDIWVNYSYDGKRRYLTIQGNDELDAGHRLKNHFKYSDGTPIERISMGASPEEAYKNLLNAFNNGVTKGGKKSKKSKLLKFKKRK